MQRDWRTRTTRRVVDGTASRSNVGLFGSKLWAKPNQIHTRAQSAEIQTPMTKAHMTQHIQIRVCSRRCAGAVVLTVWGCGDRTGQKQRRRGEARQNSGEISDLSSSLKKHGATWRKGISLSGSNSNRRKGEARTDGERESTHGLSRSGVSRYSERRSGEERNGRDLRLLSNKLRHKLGGVSGSRPWMVRRSHVEGGDSLRFQVLEEGGGFLLPQKSS
ncbi:unnamed protein product [Brassica oleracea]